jgi:hypothetical protein
MKVAWIQWSAACGAVLAPIAVLALMMSAPVQAADGVTAVAAEELDRRSKEAEQNQGEQTGAKKGMSDSGVRVLMTYAFSVIPEESPGPDGKPIKVDKANPNKYFIPTDDARRVIRAATRSAYAEVCKLPEMVRKNYETLMKGEEARKVWTPEQLVMINALHMFAVSYFTGNIQITTKEVDEPATAQADGATTVSKAEAPPAGGEQAPAGGDAKGEVTSAEAPDCPPEQKQKVTNAINAYVQAAQVAPAKP